MRLQETITDYLNHIHHERGLSRFTCLHYQCWLRHFADWRNSIGQTDNTIVPSFTVSILRQDTRSDDIVLLHGRTQGLSAGAGLALPRVTKHYPSTGVLS